MKYTLIVITLESDQDAKDILNLVIEAQAQAKKFEYVPLDEDSDRRGNLLEQFKGWKGQTITLDQLVHFVENFDLWNVIGDLTCRKYFIGSLIGKHIPPKMY